MQKGQKVFIYTNENLGGAWKVTTEEIHRGYYASDEYRVVISADLAEKMGIDEADSFDDALEKVGPFFYFDGSFPEKDGVQCFRFDNEFVFNEFVINDCLMLFYEKGHKEIVSLREGDYFTFGEDMAFTYWDGSDYQTEAVSTYVEAEITGGGGGGYVAKDKNGKFWSIYQNQVYSGSDRCYQIEANEVVG